MPYIHSLLALLFLSLTSLSPFPGNSKDATTFLSPLPRSPLSMTLSPSKKVIETKRDSQKTSLPPIHILLLGMDSRIGDSRPRCDAIHVISLFPDLGTVRITSVPRGTSIDLSTPEKVSLYVSNACHTLGIEQTIPYIEKIAGIRTDKIVKVGFSQTIGILRALKLPANDTLQFLRNRRFGIGDYQRSHNQALFLKDMIVTRLDQFLLIPKPLLYVLFKTLDTDLDFETALTYLQSVKEAGGYKNQSGVELVVKPGQTAKTREIHADIYKNANVSQKDQEYISFQENLLASTSAILNRARYLYHLGNAQQVLKTIETVYNQKIWLQIDDAHLRNQMYYEFVSLFAQVIPDKKKAASEILDFTTLMDQMGEKELEEKADALLASITKE